MTITVDICDGESDSCEMASQSQFLGVQFAAVMLVGLLVGVERHATDAAVDASATRSHLHSDVTGDVVSVLSTCRSLVFARRKLHMRTHTHCNLEKCAVVSIRRRKSLCRGSADGI